MSEENVEIARRGYEAVSRGDLEDMTADFAPEFEYQAMGMIPGTRSVYGGPGGYRKFISWLWDEFREPRVEVNDLIDAGDQVLAELTLRGRGRQSGVETSWDLWQLWTMRDGKVVHGQGFISRADAIEAAGLSQ